MTTGEVLANLGRDTKNPHDRLSLPPIRKEGEYYLQAGESGSQPPAPPWQAQIERARRVARPVLIGKFEIAGAVQAGEVEGEVTVVHENGTTFVATKLEGASVVDESAAVPLDAFVCDAAGHLAIAGVAA